MATCLVHHHHHHLILLVWATAFKKAYASSFQIGSGWIWQECSSSKYASIDWRSRIFDLTSHFPDGGHDAILCRKVLPPGERTRMLIYRKWWFNYVDRTCSIRYLINDLSLWSVTVRSSKDMHVFRLWQSDPWSVHPACGAGLGVACVLPQVRRLWSYAGGDAHLFRTRWKNLLQDGLSQVRLGHAQALKFLYIRLHCLLCCYEYRGLCFLSIIYMLFLSP